MEKTEKEKLIEMSHKQGQETTNYIDGLKVKIAEKYKPPPRINLVMSYSQRLSLNKKIQDNMPNYDFALEEKVKDKLKEYKSARKLNLDVRNERLEKIMEARKKFEEKLLEMQSKINQTKSVNSTADASNVQYGSVSNKYETNSNVLIPTQVSNKHSIDILLPTVSNRSDYVNAKPNDKSPFNISEFEADTSSPFDNMELKTINDMEELAMVLKREEKSVANINNQQYSTSYTSPSQTYINYTTSQANNSVASYPCSLQPSSAYTYNRTNGYYYDPYLSNFNYKLPFNYNSADQNFDSSTIEQNNALKSVPDIMKDLQTELNNSHINNTTNKGIYNDNIALSNSTSCNQSDQITSKHINEINNKHELENPFNNLTKELQALSLNVSSMGFPLDRVARACSILGNDHKKIVEYLLAMTELLDLGFSENKVSTALLQSNNDRDKALDILIM